MKTIPFDGQIISDPGIYSNVPIEAYHHNPFCCDGFSISSSGLRDFIKRPSLYWAYSPYNVNRFEPPEEQHFVFGKAAHLLLVEDGAGFKEQYAIRPDTYPNNPDKKWHSGAADCKEWLEEHTAKEILRTEDLKHIEHIQGKLAAHPAIQGGVLDGLTETSMFAKFGNIWLRARPDKIPVHSGDFADLKTSAAIAYEDLERSIAKTGYHIQAAICRMVAKKVMGEDWQFNGFAFVFVEKKPPYDVRILQLREQDIDLGEKQVRRALADLEQCISRNEWPGEEGFAQSIDFIGLPAWARTRIENDISYKEQDAA